MSNVTTASATKPARRADRPMPFGGGQRFRIAHVLPWNTVGGIEIATLRIAQAIRERDFDSVFFCPGVAGGAADMVREAGFDVVAYEPAELSLRRPAPFLLTSRLLARRFREHAVSLVHFSDIQGAYNGGLAARLARLPAVCHVRSRYAKLSRRDQLLLAPVQHFVFVSRATWRRFSLRVSPWRGTVIYDGLDVEAATLERTGRDGCRREFGIPPDVPVIGTVARVAEVKDYFTLARAAKCVVEHSPNAVFLVVGDHSSAPTYRRHYAEVQAVVEDLGLTDRFVFTGHRKDVHRALGAMDIFVLSTHLEGLPLVLIEAAAHALPILATDVDGVPEIITHGETGLLHPHENDALLADHMIRCLHDPGLRTQLGTAARTRLLTRFSQQHFADSLIEFYYKLLGVRARVTEARSDAS